MLSNDTDKTIKTSLSHQLRFLIAICEKSLVQQYFMKTVFFEFLILDR
jgi:hypothetical protein